MKKRLFAILFLVLMTVLGIASVVGYLQARALDENSPKQEATYIPAVPMSVPMSVPEWIVSRAELFTNSENPLSPIFRRTLNLFRRNIFLNGDNPFVKLPNGYYTYLFPYSDPAESRSSLLDFVGWLKERDIKYLSFIAADKGDDTYAVFPEGIPHGYSRMAEEYREFNREHGIEFLESRESLVAHNGDFFYWFYKADHHWNAHAGLLMAGETAKRLNDFKIEADAEAVRPECFELACYPNSFTGSMGRKLVPQYKEDLEVYFPKEESGFHIQIPSLGIDRTGSFESTLTAGQYLQSESTSYSAFLYGDPPLVRIENILSGNTTRVLVIKQSKADVLCTYLAFSVRYLDMIDPRHFYGSIRSFIEQTEPDIVITCNDVMYEGNEQFWMLR